MTANPLTDDSVSPAWDDSGKSFDDLVRPLIAPVHDYLRRRVPSATEADDCLSDVLLVLWRHRERLPEEPTETRMWAFGIAKGVLANYWRAQGRRAALHTRIAEEERIRAIAAQDSATSRVHDALAKLNSADRELVTMVIWDGFGVAEAGKLLGLSAAAARTRHSRIRARLRIELETDEPNRTSLPAAMGP